MQRSSCSRMIRAALSTLLMLAPPFSIAWIMYAVSWDYLLDTRGIDAAFVFLNPFGSTIAVSGWVIFLGLLAVFPLWLNDVSKLVDAQFPLPFSSKRAALSFFVPIQQIGLPYKILRSILFRLERRLGRDALLFYWSLAWVFMFAGGIAYAATDLLGARFMPHSLIVLWVYGAASIFCLLSLLIVHRVENGILGLSALLKATSPEPDCREPALSEITDTGVVISLKQVSKHGVPIES